MSTETAKIALAALMTDILEKFPPVIAFDEAEGGDNLKTLLQAQYWLAKARNELAGTPGGKVE